MWQYFWFLQLCRWSGPSGMCCCVIRWAIPNSLKEHGPSSSRVSPTVQPHISEAQNLWIYCCVFMILLSLGLKLELHAIAQCCVLSNGNGQHSQWIKNISCCLGITPLYWLVNGHWNSGVFSLQSQAACHVDYLDVWPWKLLHFLLISNMKIKCYEGCLDMMICISLFYHTIL